MKISWQKGKEIVLKMFDNARLTASSLSSLVNNLAEGIHKINSKYEQDNK